jgi:hypothetical protein
MRNYILPLIGVVSILCMIVFIFINSCNEYNIQEERENICKPFSVLESRGNYIICNSKSGPVVKQLKENE